MAASRCPGQGPAPRVPREHVLARAGPPARGPVLRPLFKVPALCRGPERPLRGQSGLGLMAVSGRRLGYRRHLVGALRTPTHPRPRGAPGRREPAPRLHSRQGDSWPLTPAGGAPPPHFSDGGRRRRCALGVSPMCTNHEIESKLTPRERRF